MIGPEDVPILGRLGVRVVLSAHLPDDFTVQLLADYGIEHVAVPMSDTFRHSETILAVADRYEPAEILVHCQHGADRTGVIAAFLLVMRHNWLVPDALYAVLAPTPTDVAGLAAILEEYDLPDVRSNSDASVGFYSVAATGGNGGLKTQGSGYVRLISTTLETIEHIESGEHGEEIIPWDGEVDWFGGTVPDEP